MRNRNQKDNRFIKDQWFDDYCFYKLVIDEKDKHTSPSAGNNGCAYAVIVVILFLMLVSEIAKAL